MNKQKQQRFLIAGLLYFVSVFVFAGSAAATESTLSFSFNGSAVSYSGLKSTYGLGEKINFNYSNFYYVWNTDDVEWYIRYYNGSSYTVSAQ